MDTDPENLSKPWTWQAFIVECLFDFRREGGLSMAFETVINCEVVLIHSGFTETPPIRSLLLSQIEALGIFLLEVGRRKTKTF